MDVEPGRGHGTVTYSGSLLSLPLSNRFEALAVAEEPSTTLPGSLLPTPAPSVISAPPSLALPAENAPPYGAIPIAQFPALYNDLCVALRQALAAQQCHGPFFNPLMRQLVSHVDKVAVHTFPRFRPVARTALGDEASPLRIVDAMGGDAMWGLMRQVFKSALITLARDHPGTPLVWMEGQFARYHPHLCRWLADAMDCAMVDLCHVAHLKCLKLQPMCAQPASGTGPSNCHPLPSTRADGGGVSLPLARPLVM